MFDTDADDEGLFSEAQDTAPIPVTVVANDDDVKLLVQRLGQLGSFVIHETDHASMQPETAEGIVLFRIRMMEAFEDLTLIRNWRSARPLQPIIALSENDDEDFMLEAFKSGATNYHSPVIPPAVLAEVLKSYYKMSEAPRLVEIQNAEMIRSMQAERQATEARMAAEGARVLAEAEAAASQRTKEILDNLTEGFFIVEKNLRIADVTSHSCEVIFGRTIASEALGSALDLKEGREGFLKDGLEQLFDDFMPLDVNVSLLPKRVETLCEKTISLEYHPILDAKGSPEKVIIAAMDITADVKTQAHLEGLRKASENLLRILSERESFEEFLAESKRDLESLRETDDLALGKRLLHTLKGNSSVMGLEDVAGLVHGLETELDTNPSTAVFGAYADQIDKSFEDFLEKHRKILQIDWHSSESHVTLKSSTIEDILTFVRSAKGEGREAIQQVLESTRFRSVHSMLSGFDEIAHKLGERFGKQIEFKLIGGDLKLDPVVYGPLMKSLVHALRNACDHGIEEPEERERLGKPALGVITFKFEHDHEGQLRVTLSDSGRGIQLKRVLDKALANYLISEAELESLRVRDVMHLVFHDGLSTAASISETSGRGVGMACIRQEVEALGGTIRIASKANKGTVFELNLPFSEAS